MSGRLGEGSERHPGGGVGGPAAEPAVLIGPRVPPPQPSLSLARLAPRELMLGWCLWLIGTWLLMVWRIGFFAPVHRWMVLAAAVGLLGVWPAVRLSERGLDDESARRVWQDRMRRRNGHAPADRRRRDARRGGLWVGTRWAVFTDWLLLNLVFQAVLWPMGFAARWSLEQVLWIDAAVASWSLLTGVVVAWGCSSSGAGSRWAAMLMALAVIVAEPLLLVFASWWGGGGGQSWPVLRLSPLQTLWALAGEPYAFTLTPWAGQVMTVAVAAVLGWAVLLLLPWRPAFPRP